jgi:cell division protein ZapA
VSEVALPIGGRTYRVACAPGEEERVTRLGAVVAEKLAAMGNLSGHEAQNLLFAALLLADEAYEKRDGSERSGADIAAMKAEAEAAERARAEAEAELARLRDAQHSAAEALESASVRIAELGEENAALRERIAAGTPTPSASSGVSAAELAPALERLAEMLEDCADKLERDAAAP